MFSRKRDPLPEVSSEKRDFFTRSVYQESRPLRRKCHLGKWTPLPEVFSVEKGVSPPKVSSGKVDLFVVSVVRVRKFLCLMCSPGKGALLPKMTSGKGDPFGRSVVQERGPL